MKEKPTKRLNPVSTRRLDPLTTMGMGIAHDFNNLLAAILGNALVAGRSLQDNLGASESVHQIESCALRGLEMTNRLLTFTGRAPFTARQFDLSELVQSARDRIAEFETEDVSLSLCPGKGLPKIMGDTTQIRQLLMELVTNSSEALIDRTGTITIETGTMHCTRKYLHSVSIGAEAPAGEYAYIQVSDNGRGISMRDQKSIFDPFFTTKMRGQGLGLCVVLGVLRAHDGAIEVETRTGQGSRFKALFPVRSKS